MATPSTQWLRHGYAKQKQANAQQRYNKGIADMTSHFATKPTGSLRAICVRVCQITAITSAPTV